MSRPASQAFVVRDTWGPHLPSDTILGSWGRSHKLCGATVSPSPAASVPKRPPMGTGGPPSRAEAHSLSQPVLGPAVLVGVREDASVPRGGREGVTSTAPAVTSGVTEGPLPRRPPLGWRPWRAGTFVCFLLEFCHMPRKVPAHGGLHIRVWSG